MSSLNDLLVSIRAFSALEDAECLKVLSQIPLDALVALHQNLNTKPVKKKTKKTTTLFSCEFCDKKFKRKWNRDRHVSIIHNNEKLKCPFVDCKEEQEAGNLARHFEDEHGVTKKRKVGEKQVAVRHGDHYDLLSNHGHLLHLEGDKVEKRVLDIDDLKPVDAKGEGDVNNSANGHKHVIKHEDHNDLLHGSNLMCEKSSTGAAGMVDVLDINDHLSSDWKGRAATAADDLSPHPRALVMGLLNGFGISFILLGVLAYYVSIEDNVFPTSPYTQGNFGPIDEEFDFTTVSVSGKLPNITGSFIRTGPNPLIREGPYHWFDGDGFLHAVQFRENGDVVYGGKYVKTYRYTQSSKSGRRTGFRIGSLQAHPAKTLVKLMIRETWHNLVRWFTGEQKKYHRDGTVALGNTALMRLPQNGQLLALMEGDLPISVSVSLDTSGVFWKDKLNTGMTAHPKVLRTNEVAFFHYALPEKKAFLARVSPKGELLQEGSISLNYQTGMMHDMGATDSHSVILDLPLVMDFPGAVSGKAPLCYLDQSSPSYFHIVPKGNLDGRITFEHPSGIAIVHTSNTFHIDDHLIALRACVQHGPFVLFGPKSLEVPLMSELTEIVFDLKSRKIVKFEPIKDSNGEFPTINPLYSGRRNRFSYLASFRDNLSADGIKKIDHDLKQVTHQIKYQDNGFGGEPFFVRNTDESCEDCGWLMTYVYVEKTNSSELQIFDAKNLEKVASVKIPRRVPYGFHGLFVPETSK